MFALPVDGWKRILMNFLKEFANTFDRRTCRYNQLLTVQRNTCQTLPDTSYYDVPY